LVVWSGLLVSARAEAQSTFERDWIDVNFGVAIAAEDAFSMRATGELYDEPADFGADYGLPRGASFDFGGGFMITPIVGVGVSFSGMAHNDVASLDARIPHPRIFNVYATDEALTDQALERIEGGVNVQAMIVAAQTDRFRLRVFGGPTYFRVQQAAVTISASTISTSSSCPSRSRSRSSTRSAWRAMAGFHAGVEASVFFGIASNRSVGTKPSTGTRRTGALASLSASSTTSFPVSPPR